MSNTTDLVTILIPTYNRAEYLHDAIRSALAQTHKSIEVIVLDDCSPDQTPNIISKYASENRLRYIRHAQNIGIASNWRAGIEAARGEYFCFLHDDDTLESDYIERLLPPLIHDNNVAVSFCDHWAMNTKGQRLVNATEEIRSKFKRDILPSGVVDNFAKCALVDASLPVGATIFRRSVVKTDFISEQARGSIDMWLFYQIIKTGYSAHYTPEKLMNYRLHDGAMTASMPLYMRQGHIYRYQRMLQDETLAMIHAELRVHLARTLLDQGKAFLIRGQRNESRKLLKEALSNDKSLNGLLAYTLACTGPLGTLIANRIRHHSN